ncbi:MAG: HDOD domain-containing protein, partial [Pseudomonadota bacterium]
MSKPQRKIEPELPSELPVGSEADPSGNVQAAFLDDKIELPNLPEVAWKVREAMVDPDISIEDIALIVQNDPAISARLVQVANSALYRGLTKVENLRMVVGRLGLKATQNLVTMICVAFSPRRPTTIRRFSTLVSPRYKALLATCT